MIPNTFGMPFTLLYFSWIILIHLNPEMRRFAYSGIIWEDCKGTLCSSPIGEARVAVDRLNSVGFCTLLECLTWWLRPRWWDLYTVEGLGAYDMAYITWTDSGSSIMPLGEAWVSDPRGRSWRLGYSKSSWEASLGKGMLEDLLRYHSLEGVKFSCVASFNCSSTRFFQFLGTEPFLMCYTS